MCPNQTGTLSMGIGNNLYGDSPEIHHLGGPEMADAHKLDCESAEADCRFIIQSENEEEAVELAKKHMKEVHGQDFTDDELRQEHLQVV